MAYIFVESMRQLMIQLIIFVPKIFVALIIWYVGVYFLGLLTNLFGKIKVKEATQVNKLIDSLTFLVMPFGKFILFLIVLDYLGIGRTVIQALLSGVTFAIAIAFGIAFGKALEDDARAVVESVKKRLNK
jgi:hypothetical protein